jgi:hypothetical protein
MSPAEIFPIVNVAALTAWMLLALWPRQHRVPRVVAGLAVPAGLAAIYVAIVGTQWSSTRGGFSTLDDVALLFSHPWLLLAGWIHYLAFDLLVGCWEARDARERGVPHVVVVPCLALTFLFGPAGWLAYLGVRAAYRKPGATPAGKIPFGA